MSEIAKLTAQRPPAESESHRHPSLDHHIRSVWTAPARPIDSTRPQDHKAFAAHSDSTTHSLPPLELIETKFSRLNNEQKLQVIESGVNNFSQSISHEVEQAKEGVGEGAFKFGKGMVDLGIGAAQLAWNAATLPQQAENFGALCANDPAKAFAEIQNNLEATRKASELTGKLWNAGAQYTSDAFTGKVNPFSDIAHKIESEEEKWEHLSTKEKAAAGTELLLSFIPLERGCALAKTAMEATGPSRLEAMRALCTKIDEGLAKVDKTISKYTCEAKSLEDSSPSDVRQHAARRKGGPSESSETPEKPEEVEALPINSIISKMFEIRGKIEPRRIGAITDALGDFPETDLRGIQKSGYKILITNSLEEAKDCFPKGSREGGGLAEFLRKNKDAYGITVPQTKTMILFTDRNLTGNMNTARHEFAHAMAHICGWEKNKSLLTKYTNIAATMNDRFKDLRLEAKEAEAAGRTLSKAGERELEDLIQIEDWFDKPPQYSFNETVADMYAIAHGGSNGLEVDTILEDRFAPMMQAMEARQWYRQRLPK
ncbi:MAG: hypothetical protein ACRD3W_23225 [Terriglobales bacterium]